MNHVKYRSYLVPSNPEIPASRYRQLPIIVLAPRSERTRDRAFRPTYGATCKRITSTYFEADATETPPLRHCDVTEGACAPLHFRLITRVRMTQRRTNTHFPFCWTADWLCDNDSRRRILVIVARQDYRFEADPEHYGSLLQWES